LEDAVKHAKQPVVWVVIADGEHARIVTPTRVTDSFTTIQQVDSLWAHRKSADMGTERPGRVHESASTTRHAVEPKHDLHREAKRAFVKDVAEHLEAPSLAGSFDQLVLVAPDRALHELREAVSHEVAAKVIGVLDKDLTKVPDGALGEHLAQWWKAPAHAPK
jgi:protein required for attachment to host cells